MIVHALFMMSDDRKGPSRDSLWKFAQNNFKDSITDKKQFFTQLRRLATIDGLIYHPEDNKSRFKLDRNFKNRYTTALATGKSIPVCVRNAITSR